MAELSMNLDLSQLRIQTHRRHGGIPTRQPLGGDLSRFLDHRMRAVPPPFRGYWSDDSLRENALLSLTSELDLVQLRENAEAFRAACPVPNARVDDYQPKRFVVSRGLQLIAGIRFYNLNLKCPFVEIVESTGRLVRPALAQECIFLTRFFSVFDPIAVRFKISGSNSFIPNYFPNSTAAKVLMAAPIETVAAADLRPHQQSKVVLRRSSAANFYERYVNTYEHFRMSSPSIAKFVRREMPEDFLRAEQDGGLFEIFVGNEWAGVISAWRTVDGALSGFSINEFMLSEPYKGKGLGPAVQREFARKLKALKQDALFGTIHCHNKRALKVASRVGRAAAYTQYWLPVRELSPYPLLQLM